MSSCRPLRPIRQESIADLERWYPRVRKPPAQDTFEIGLVLTGGQSAGCYLAGVMDFLFQALDAWHRARSKDPDNTPNHHVKIKIIVGASAGGLNAAIAAIAARYRWTYAVHPEFENRDENLGSPFYRAWVRDVDITHLLTTDDLKLAGNPLSVLNSAYLHSKVGGYLDFTGEAVEHPDHRAWLDDPLPIKIATSNVSGVPYGIRFTGYRAGATGNLSYQMGLHRDYQAFQRPIFRDAPTPTIPDHEPLPMSNRADHAGWDRLGKAGLATIAFPVALAEGVLERPSTDYEYRFASATPSGFAYAQPFPNRPECQVRSVTVDGGLMDNEPFDLAHAALAGANGSNEQRGELARRAVIMIDPFVSARSQDDDGEPTGLLTALKNIWQALVSQSQFKLIDLALAEADEVYSRFLIGPVRHEAGKTIRGDSALASHPLNHYFGYFSEHYRHHDFMLGRQNCYLFLRDWFVLPCDWDIRETPDPNGPKTGNQLFESWPQAALRNASFKSRSPFCINHRQIIPLVGTAAVEPGLYPWPRGKFQGFEAIRDDVATRVSALYARLRGDIAAAAAQRSWSRALVRILISVAWWLKGRRWLTGKIQDSVERARAIIERG
jgi:hypothetical protein